MPDPFGVNKTIAEVEAYLWWVVEILAGALLAIAGLAVLLAYSELAGAARTVAVVIPGGRRITGAGGG
jgi:uncharacterized protein YybS (DUF2232 family)